MIRSDIDSSYDERSTLLRRRHDDGEGCGVSWQAGYIFANTRACSRNMQMKSPAAWGRSDRWHPVCARHGSSIALRMIYDTRPAWVSRTLGATADDEGGSGLTTIRPHHGRIRENRTWGYTDGFFPTNIEARVRVRWSRIRTKSSAGISSGAGAERARDLPSASAIPRTYDCSRSRHWWSGRASRLSWMSVACLPVRRRVFRVSEKEGMRGSCLGSQRLD